MSKATKRETNAAVLKQAMIRRLPRRLSGQGEMALPPAPALLEHYVKIFDQIWEGMGRKFNEAEIGEFRNALKLRLEQAFDSSPTAKVIVSYQTDPPPKTSITWKIVAMGSSFADEYAHWVSTRTPPLFGKHPDAKALDMARSLGPPGEVTVLDVGAGTGRNTLPLAREGFLVDALEPAPALCQVLRDEVAAERGSAGSPFEIVDMRGPGYGSSSPDGEAIAALAAETEGLLLDPVFSAKAMAVLLGPARPPEPVVFWHTGGLPVALASIQGRATGDRG